MSAKQLVQNLVEQRILDIEYLLDMDEIGRDVLSNDKQAELLTELDGLKFWLKQTAESQGYFNGNYDKWVAENVEEVDDYDALMAIACR